jgi:hypothetical protein
MCDFVEAIALTNPESRIPRYNPSMPYLGQPQPIDHEAWQASIALLRPILAGEPVPPEALQPLEANLPGLASVGPFIAWQLKQSGQLDELTPATRERLQHTLRQHGVLHLVQETGIKELFAAFQQENLRALLIKGHAIGRTHYPSPLCRPTSDVDVWVDPERVDEAEGLLRKSGFEMTQRHSGRLWHAANGWRKTIGGLAFHLDLHWDISNRWYFRHRLDFNDAWRRKRDIEIAEQMVTAPGDSDAFIIACVHLAAMDPGITIEPRWLLDVYLLMQSMNEEDQTKLLKICQASSTIEACSTYASPAVALGENSQATQLTSALQNASQQSRVKAYDKTLGSRFWDYLSFRGRLENPRARKDLWREFIQHAKMRDEKRP